ncbi:MAG: TIR domain-containing protein [Bacteroidaceae bacterium]|nr:TIR domain-containing protein [Bacteroidaceae bacterium]
MNVYDIFISYSNKNVKEIDKIVDIIQGYKVNCWYQKRNSKNDFIKEINLGIKESKAFVVFLSSASIKSIRVKNEINRAIKKHEKDSNFTILPVIIEDLDEDEDDEMELLIGSFTWIYQKDYPDLYSLVLSIFSQLNIKLAEDENSRSIYTGDEDTEIKRLKIQNEYLNKFAGPYLDEIFADYKNPLVLDVGCADGSNTHIRFNGRKYRALLGIDKNHLKINTANSLYRSDKNTFQYCDVTTDDLDRVLSDYLQEKEQYGFDIIHLSAVLLHVEEPEKLLKKLHGYLSKDGTIFIQDEDDGVNLVYPRDKRLEDCFYIWKHSKESGNRIMGRTIPYMLSKNGYSQIKLLSSQITSLDFNGEMKECLWDLYFNSDLWVVDNASYFDDIKAFELLQTYKEGHSKLREEYMNGRYFIMLGIFYISARK